MRWDPSGCFWDTILDIGFAVWSLVDFIKNPTWANAGWLALDLVFLAIPFIPGIGKGAKALTKADDIVDAVGFVNKYDNVIVLGQSMGKRVIPYADEIGATVYKGLSNFDDLKAVYGIRKASWIGYVDNMGFIISNSLSGAKFIDKGFDATRSIKAAKMLGKEAVYIERMSRFTIYSERFLAQTMRLQNLIRLYQHIYF